MHDQDSDKEAENPSTPPTERAHRSGDASPEVSEIKNCAICGGQRVKIRGLGPNRQRTVCPTCLAERMDEICAMSSMDYGAPDLAATDSADQAAQLTDDEIRRRCNYHEGELKTLKEEGSKVWRLRVRMGCPTPKDRELLAATGGKE